jgi:hypothetical protein
MDSAKGNRSGMVRVLRCLRSQWDGQWGERWAPTTEGMRVQTREEWKEILLEEKMVSTWVSLMEKLMADLLVSLMEKRTG